MPITGLALSGHLSLHVRILWVSERQMWYVLVLADQQDLPAICAQNPAGCVGARFWVRSLSLVPVVACQSEVHHSTLLTAAS